MTDNTMKYEMADMMVGRYYEFQEMRKATMNRVRNIIFRRIEGVSLSEKQEKKEDKEYLKEYADAKLLKKYRDNLSKFSDQDQEYMDRIMQLAEDVKEKEKEYSRMVHSLVQAEYVWTEFGQYMKGIGPLLMAGCIYYFGYCEKAPHRSSMWKYVGYTPNAKHTKDGDKSFNPKARVFMYRIADCLIKQRSPRYRPYYDNEKERQLNLMEQKSEWGPNSKGHAHLRAIRKMMRIFLADYWVVCRTARGLPIEGTYVMEHKGHQHYDDILLWVDQEKKRLLSKV